jgi:hypothetical protein
VTVVTLMRVCLAPVGKAQHADRADHDMVAVAQVAQHTHGVSRVDGLAVDLTAPCHSGVGGDDERVS